jgi:hypothetical protein
MCRISWTAKSFPLSQGCGRVRTTQPCALEIEIDLRVSRQGQSVVYLGFSEQAIIIGLMEPKIASLADKPKS